MIMLHSALLKLLQVLFDNFQSDYRVQELTGGMETCDVEENTEIFQFNISSLYQLQAAWTNKYECTSSSEHKTNELHSDENTGSYICLCLCHYF